ncbi:MAG: hypothetical protein OXH86_18975 [Acidimicrobiaceae bacterium]|nr:hypothetical protein [Acidimicrobiaceae bacterium]
MIDETRVLTLIAAGAGLVVGMLLGAIVRRLLSRKHRRPAVRELARPASVFVFWLSLATGVVIATAMTNPETLEPLPSEVLRWLPNVLAAGLVLLVGYALGVVLSTSLSQGLLRATGQRSRMAQRTIRTAVMVGAVIVALGQLGIETRVLLVLMAGAIGALALAFGLLAGLGGREAASAIAAGRLLQGDLEVGQRILIDDVPMEIIRLRAATVTLQAEDSTQTTVISYDQLLKSPIVVLPPGSHRRG